MNTSYDKWGNLEPAMIYLAKPGKRLIGAIPGIDEDSCRYEKNLNNTNVLEFDVYRDIDGEINPVYEYIQQHYELVIPGMGWFKINEEPEITSDGNVETKSVRAESLEIELQQYDVANFYINTAGVMSKEMLAVDNTYDLEGFNMFRDQVLFYRDVTDLEELREVFMGTTASDLQGYLYDHPDILQCWRIDFDYDLLDTDLQAAANEYRTAGKSGTASQVESLIGTIKKGTPAKKERVLLVCSNYPYLLKHIHITVEMYDNPDDHTSYLNDMYEVIDKQIARMKGLSLMHLILDEHGWKVGEIGGSVRKRTFSDYVYVNIDNMLGSTTNNEYSKLCNSVGQFEVETQDIYSFMTQEVSSYFECLFDFDTDNYLVNAYKIDDVGLDTNIYLSFHNIQNSVSRGSDRQIYTVFNVQGGDDLYPDEANFGESWIENIDYFLTTDHFTQEFIDKYTDWKEHREGRRQDYMTASINRRKAQEKADEIYDRVPVDIADTHQYSTMSDNELVEEYNRYEALLIGYESLYVDEDGTFQPETIMKVVSPKDYSDYYMIYNQVLPNIQTALYNRQVPSGSDTRDYLDGWQYDFATYGDSYGVGELKTSMTTLQNSIKTLTDKGYNVYPDDDDLYKIAQYELYCKYRISLAQCEAAYDARVIEWNDAMDNVNDYLNEMNDIKDDVDIENGNFGFTIQDLWLLDKYRIWTDYTNENIATTANSTAEERVGKAYELIQDAQKQLSAESQPQWTFQTTQDNLLLMPEFESWHKQLDVGNFVRVAMREDYQVKLRVTTISFNPFLTEPVINLTFSNMIQYASKRDDFVSLLENGRSSSKNQISATITSSTKASDINVDTAFVLKLINNGTFSSYMGSFGTDAASGAISAVSGAISGLVADSISAVTINVGQIVGTTAEFEELFAQYIDSEYIVTRVLNAESADIQSLTAEIIRVGTDSITEIADGRITTAEIDVGQLRGDFGEFAELVADNLTANTIATKLLDADAARIEALAAAFIDADNIKAGIANINLLEAGSVFADSAFIRSLQSISATSAQSTINDAYIRNAVVGKISVADLSAGNIVLTDDMKIISENGALVMDGNALQIIGEDSSGNPYIGIQLGYDTSSNPSLILRNEDGATVLTPQGITQDAIADQLIINDMIALGTIGEERLAFNIMKEGDTISIEQVMLGGESFGVEYTEFKSSTNSLINDLSAEIDSKLGVVGSENHFAIWDSGTDPPAIYRDFDDAPLYDYDGKYFGDTDWTSEIPEVPDGMYLWSRTTFLLSDGSEAYMFAVMKNGLTAQRDRKQFYLSDSLETLAGGEWSYDAPATIPENKYLFTRTEYTMTDGSIRYSDALYDATFKGVINKTNELEGYIQQKIWQTDIDASITNYDTLEGNVTIRDRISEYYQDISGLKTTVSDIITTSNNTIERLSLTTQTADKIYWLVKDNTDQAHMELTSQALNLVANDINAKGRVNFSGLHTNVQERIIGIETDLASTTGTADSAHDILELWTNSATLADTTINGGYIKSHTIQAEHLATNAIMSFGTYNQSTGQYTGGYQGGSASSPYSTRGSFLDLENGNIMTPNFAVINKVPSGKTYSTGAYFNGHVTATSLTIGTNSSLSIQQGTIGATTAGIAMNNGTLQASNAIIYGTIYASNGTIGGWTIGTDKLYYSSATPSSTSMIFSPKGVASSIDIGGSGASNHNWLITAKNVFGVTTDGYLYTTQGNIAGFTIKAGKLYYGTSAISGTGSDTVGVYVGTNGIRNYKDSTHYVNISEGVITAKGATITGIINATSGTIGDLTLAGGAIYYNLNSVTGTANGWYLGTSGFRNYKDSSTNVTIQNGVLTAKSAKITGEITASKLTLTNGEKISTNDINGLASVATTGSYNSLKDQPTLTVYLRKDGTPVGNPVEGGTGIKVEASGVLTCANAVVWGTIYSSVGKIGGWNLSTAALWKDTTTSHTTPQVCSTSVLVSTGFTSSVSIAGSGATSRTWAFTASDKFGVTTGGALFATSATISGVLTASANSVIGPWTVTSSSIQTGNYNTSGKMYFGTSGISISTQFKVDSAGKLTATGAAISGTLSAGSGSTIGPWTINDAAIYRSNATYGASGGIYFGTSGISLGNLFTVSAAGALTASSGTIGGINIKSDKIYSGSHTTYDSNSQGFYLDKYGYFGIGDSNTYFRWNKSTLTVKGTVNAVDGSTIGSNTNAFSVKNIANTTSSAIFFQKTSLSSAQAGVYVGTNGISLGAKASNREHSPFEVDSNGNLYAYTATIEGTLTAGTGSSIGPWTINADAIYRGNANWGNSSGMYFGTKGISLGSAFKVSSTGALTATGASIGGTLTAGNNSQIGPWHVTNDSIWKGNATMGHTGSDCIYIGANGLSVSNVFKVSNTGKLTCTNAEITGTGGTTKIGNWLIDANGFLKNSSGTIILSPSNDAAFNDGLATKGFLKIGNFVITSNALPAASQFSLLPYGTINPNIQIKGLWVEDSSGGEIPVVGGFNVCVGDSSTYLIANSGVICSGSNYYNLIDLCTYKTSITNGTGTISASTISATTVTATSYVNAPIYYVGGKEFVKLLNNEIVITSPIKYSPSGSSTTYNLSTICSRTNSLYDTYYGKAARKVTVAKNTAFTLIESKLYLVLFWHNNTATQRGAYLIKGGQTITVPLKEASGITISLSGTTFKWNVSSGSNTPNCELIY